MMKSRTSKFANRTIHSVMSILSVALLSVGNPDALAQQPEQRSATAPPEAPKIPNDQLDSLVSPIALYPDPLLAQTLAASTYPLEIIQLQQWMDRNKNLKDKALADEVEKQNWDPSIQAMAAFPDVVKQLAGNISWTSDLGNAFLSQQSDVFDAVQRMRAKANAAGKLKSTPQMKVETKVVETKTVVVIEQADPKVVYVPTYNPTVVYGTAVYPYPPIYYPPVTAPLLTFGAGIALGAAWSNGWGYNCGWGHNNVNINVNNNYVNHYNKNNINNVNRNNVNNVNRSGNTWQHNPQHRGGAPYSNKNLTNKYSSDLNRGPNANRPSSSDRNRNDTAADRNRPNNDRVNQGPAADRNKPGADRASTRPSSSGPGDRIGNQQVSRNSSPRSNSAFNSGGFNRSSAMTSHDRGSRSMSSSRGGGRRR